MRPQDDLPVDSGALMPLVGTTKPAVAPDRPLPTALPFTLLGPDGGIEGDAAGVCGVDGECD